MPLKIYTPFEKGQLAWKAGCTVHDYPEELSVQARKEWQEGWTKADAICKLHENDLEKFHKPSTGE